MSASGGQRRFKKPPVWLRAAERDELLHAIADVRDKAIVTTFLFGGLRLNELTHLDRGDVDFRYRTIRIRFAKGGKERTVGLHRLAEDAIRAYLDTRADDLPPLFLSNRRRRISNRAVQHLLDRHIKACGFNASKRVTPHKLRHTFATALMKASGRDIQVVQRALGHENIATTTIYAHLDDDVLYQAMDRL